MKKIFSAFIAILVSIAVFSGCIEDTSNNENAINKNEIFSNFIGGWRGIIDNCTCIANVFFYENESVNIFISSNVTNVILGWNSFELKNSEICFTSLSYNNDNIFTCYNYTFSDDNKSLELMGGGVPFFLTKIDLESDKNRLIGTWGQVFYSGIRGTSWTFYENGTILEVTSNLSSFTSFKGDYELKDGELCIEGDIGISTWFAENRTKFSGCHFYDFVNKSTLKISGVYFEKRKSL